MKNKTFKFFARGNEQKQEHVPSKYDANLRKNGFLNFQIGLILSLLMVYGVFQINFPENLDEVVINSDVNHKLEEEDVPIYNVIPDNPKPAVSNPDARAVVTQPVLDIFDVVVDEDPVEEITHLLKGNEDEKNAPVAISSLYSGDDAEEDMPDFIDVNAVEFVPVFPGCEKLKTNDEKSACLEEKIRKVIQKNFNAEIASDFGLTGKQRIYVQFKIDENGYVSDIQSRAPVTALEKEAERVIHKIPQLTPGRQRNQNVVVRYSIPIIFDVQ